MCGAEYAWLRMLSIKYEHMKKVEKVNYYIQRKERELKVNDNDARIYYNYY